MAQENLALARRLFRPSGPAFPVSFPAGLASVAMATLLVGVNFAGLKRKQLRRVVPVVALLLLIVTAGYLAGCAGGFTTGASSGTPSGTYTITVTGTSGTDAHSTTVTLTVQ